MIARHQTSTNQVPKDSMASNMARPSLFLGHDILKTSMKRGRWDKIAGIADLIRSASRLRAAIGTLDSSRNGTAIMISRIHGDLQIRLGPAFITWANAVRLEYTGISRTVQ